MEPERRSEHKRAGVLYVTAAFAVWGVLPVYWKALQSVPPLEILMHRIIWSLVFVSVLLTVAKRGKTLRENLGSARVRLFLLATSALIGINWFLYIWAVNNGHIVESSMGYFITPLLNVLLGMIFLRERLNARQTTALTLAAAGVIIRTAQYGGIPWISLGLALSFALYGLLKKLANLDSLIGLLGETAVLAPAALGYILFLQVRGTGAFAASSCAVTLMLAAAGIVTSVPLLLFAEGAKRVPLATVGFAQYISPSLSLCLGVLVYHEVFTGMHALSFSLIWCALLVYSFSRVKLGKTGIAA